MRKGAFLAAIICLTALAACNSYPSASAAQTWLQSYISGRFQGEFRTSDFSITSSEETILGGVPSYRVSYVATVIFPNGNQPDCLLRLCVVTAGIPFLLPGSTVRFAGVLVFQKATSSWVVAPDWAQPPQVMSVDFGRDVQCGQIADVIRLAMQNESRGRAQLPNLTNPRELSRSDAELRCSIQAEQNGGTGTLSARVYKDGSGVRLTLARDQVPDTPANSTAEQDSLDAANAAAAEMQNAANEMAAAAERVR